jgi:hypothetical protein
MCLTNTVNLIDFDNMSDPQLKQIEDLKAKMYAHKKELEERLAELNEGIKKLEDKSK